MHTQLDISIINSKTYSFFDLLFFRNITDSIISSTPKIIPIIIVLKNHTYAYPYDAFDNLPPLKIRQFKIESIATVIQQIINT